VDNARAHDPLTATSRCDDPCGAYASIMQPITRETITDRRQPTIRWSAVLAGTAVAAGLWGVLQLLGIGAGLTALEPDDPGSTRGAAIGLGALSMLAPLIATLVGGYVAAKLAHTYDRWVAGAHGLVVWGLTAMIGLGTTLWMARTAAMGAAHAEITRDAQGAARRGASLEDADLNADAKAALAPINQRLRLQGKAQISPEQLIASARAAMKEDGFDRDELIDQLDDNTPLSREDASAVVTQLGPRTESLVQRATAVTPAEHDAMKAAETTGKGLLSLGSVILLSIGTAILGALLALQRFGKRGDQDRADRERVPHTTAPYPTTSPTNPTLPPV
jgi:hypothetical protein